MYKLKKEVVNMRSLRKAFLTGTVLGGLIGALFFSLIFFTFYYNKVEAYSPHDLELATSYAIERASPHVVGIIKVNNGKDTGSGSGVIYRIDEEKAYIVTNYHVIKDAQRIEVAFENEERILAEVIGDDIITDLAVLAIPKGDINEVIEFADSSNIRVGEFVVAIGNPLGLNLYGSATLGIVSSKERLIPIDYDKDGQYDWYASVIQTDAAINPGNSGGALVNLEGKLIGINSMKVAGSSVEGIGFSIPAHIVKRIVSDLEVYGEVQRPYLGIEPINVALVTNTKELKQGVYVNDVVPNSSAYKAGIKINDIITAINGDKVKDVMDFRYKLYQYDIGDKVTLTIVRRNKTYTIDIELQGKPSR